VYLMDYKEKCQTIITNYLSIMRTSKLTPEELELINRAIEIQDEYKSLEKPYSSQYDNIDDYYQDLLEHQWHIEELKEEYDAINKQLGLEKNLY
jgi:hypothetical protein